MLNHRIKWGLAHLSALGLIAFLSAKALNQVMAAEIISLGGASSAAPPRAMTPPSPPHALWAERIVARNAFNANPPVDEPPGPDEPTPEAPLGALPGPHDECPPSGLGVGLVATMVVDPPTRSLAILDAGAAGERLSVMGDDLGGATLAAIYRERAVLQEGNQYRCLALGVPPKEGGAKIHPKPRPPKPTPNDQSTRIRDGIKWTSATEATVDGEMLKELLDDLEGLVRQARAAPHYAGGKLDGFKLKRIKRGSLFDHLRLKRGDLLQEVNRQRINSPNQALLLLDQLNSMGAVRVTLMRGGRPVTLTFNIQR